MNFKFLIIVPVYNEEKTINKVIDNLIKSPYDFVIIDDGSTDDTLSIIKNKLKELQWLSYPSNQGKGYAIKLGSKYAKIQGFSHILILDGDNQNSIEDVQLFKKALETKDNVGILIGNRLHNPVNMPILRYLTNKAMSWLISLLSKTKIKDSQCGLRLVNLEVFNLELKANRFELETEMLIKASRAGFKITNIPIRCIYGKDDNSKIKVWEDTKRFYKMIKRVMGEIK